MGYVISVVDENGEDVAYNAEMYMTYNYYPLLNFPGMKGAFWLHEKSVQETIPIIQSVIDDLPDEPPDDDGWKCTPGNVVCALKRLLELAKKWDAPGYFWSV